jgi:hypothetical protein
MWLPNETILLVKYLKWPMSHQKIVVPDTLLWPPSSNLWCLGPKNKLGVFLDTPPELDSPMGLGMVFININDYGSHIWR